MVQNEDVEFGGTGEPRAQVNNSNSDKHDASKMANRQSGMSMRYRQTAATVRTPAMRRFYGGPFTGRKSLLQAIVEVIGCESAEKMIGEFGGARIWVPVQSTPDTKLSQVLGDSAAYALCAHFGGDYLQVPNTITGDDVYRRIAELHRQGCTINEIALAVGRSRRTVFRLLRKKITELTGSVNLPAEIKRAH